METVTSLLVHRVEDLVCRVETDEVEQRERTHRVATAEPHGRVDVLARRVAALEHRHRVVEVAEEQRVGDEARLVADDDRLLVEALGQGLDVLEDVVRGDDGPDDLDELEDRRRVEEVHADDALGRARRRGDLGDRQRRGVRREDGVGGDDQVEPAEDLLLEVELLGHGLDDELAVRERGEVRGVGDVPVQGVMGGLVDLAAVECAPGRLREEGPSPLDGLVGDVHRDDVDPVAREHLHDAGTHGAQSDDADLGELT